MRFSRNESTLLRMTQFTTGDCRVQIFLLLRHVAMNVMIAAPHGHLEGLLEGECATQPQSAAILCHPHPQYGGTMHNKVVYRAAQALRERGFVTLRFNFRGVGRSTGTYDFGVGEQDDVRAAIDFMAGRYKKACLWLVGYSFGAWVGLTVASGDERIAALVGIGLPVETNDFQFLTLCRKPKFFIQGTNDEFGSVEHLNALLLTLPEPKEVIYIEGADHFFTGKLGELQTAIITCVRRFEGL